MGWDDDMDDDDMNSDNESDNQFHALSLIISQKDNEFKIVDFYPKYIQIHNTFK